MTTPVCRHIFDPSAARATLMALPRGRWTLLPAATVDAVEETVAVDADTTVAAGAITMPVVAVDASDHLAVSD